MSVSGVPSIPGFDVLFPATGSSTGSQSSGAPASSGLPSTVPGSDVLGAPLNTETVPGFDILNPAAYFPGADTIVNGAGSSSSGSASNSSTTPTIQQQYDNLQIWSSDYLISSVENPQNAAGSLASADSRGSRPLPRL